MLMTRVSLRRQAQVGQHRLGYGELGVRQRRLGQDVLHRLVLRFPVLHRLLYTAG